MKNSLLVLLLLSVHLTFANAIVWSKTGHRVTGELAQKHLSRKARKAIFKLLDGESLAKVSTFGDDIKADRKYKEFGAWHYVNFPADQKYADSEPSKYGDIMIGITTCISKVKDKNNAKEDRVFYLKLLVHLIGDLHQPMHVGRLEDKGGNDIQVQWFKRGTNLHRVWDSHMIDEYGMNYTELTASLPRLTKKQKKYIQQGTIYHWVEESQDIANRIYESVEIGENLSYRYNYVWWSTAEKQLQKGGLRLAKVLNDIFQ